MTSAPSSAQLKSRARQCSSPTPCQLLLPSISLPATRREWQPSCSWGLLLEICPRLSFPWDAGMDGQDDSKRWLTYVIFWSLWGPHVWVSFFDTMFKKQRPSDLVEYEAALGAKLRERGRLDALAQMARGRRSPCFEEASKVQCPVLLIFGDHDPDFASPEEESKEVKQALSSSVAVDVAMLPGVGHYPHVEEPQRCLEMMASYLQKIQWD